MNSASARKNQKSLSKLHNKSFDREMEEVTQEVVMMSTAMPIKNRSLVEGDDFFAPVKVLNSERVDRQ